MSDAKILIVEDTTSVAMVHQGWLKRAKFYSTIVGNGQEALDIIRAGNISVVLLDLDLPDINGQTILRTIREEGIDVTVIVVTASKSVNTAVDAMRGGAYDFIVKPASEGRLVVTVKNALEREKLQTTVRAIKSTIRKGETNGFIGSSLPMVAVYKTIEAVAQSSASVFITGESGTGKEVCAQAIHQSGTREEKPFIALNCAAIPKDLMESEIFGHLKGAFTGATTDREGAALAANGGTLFLDEICEMDLVLQSKLLRFLQTGTVQKVGSDKTVPVDVRIICATNRDPMHEVAQGRFREDLYYRLHVVPIHLPPLREREGDALEIANHLLEHYTNEEGKDFEGFDEAAKDAILCYSWPGNVRELQNTIRQAVVLNSGKLLEVDHLNLGASRLGLARSQVNSAQSLGAEQTSMMNGASLKGGDENDHLKMVVNLNQPFHDLERSIIETVIAKCGNSIPKAADILGLSPSTIYRKKENWE